MALRPHLSMGLPLSVRESGVRVRLLLFYHGALLQVNGQ